MHGAHPLILIPQMHLDSKAHRISKKPEINQILANTLHLMHVCFSRHQNRPQKVNRKSWDAILLFFSILWQEADWARTMHGIKQRSFCEASKSSFMIEQFTKPA